MRASVEERVSYLEAKIDEFGKSLMRVEGAIAALDQKMDRRFDIVDMKFERVHRAQFAILFAIIAGLVGVITKLA